MTPEERLERVFHSLDPAQALRSLVLDLSREGSTKPEIYKLLKKFLLRLRTGENDRESDEETVLDAMDALTGWCHPDAQLLPEE